MDKEVESLQAVQRQARELDVDALLASAEATSNEKEAARLLLARLAVCSALLGSYTPGADPPGEDAANKEADEFALALQNQPAELPDLLREAYPISMVIRKLHEEVRKVMSMKDKKDLEAEMKPILNLVVIMKTSIKSASDKLGKFGKDRMQKEEKQRRSMEIAQQKMLTTEKKRREQEERKLTKAAEKQGRVGSLFEIDYAKLGVPLMDQCVIKDAEAVKALDWSKPWVAKLESEQLKSVNAALKDPKVAATMDSFYHGFPGSPAALQGSKRFTVPIEGTDSLRRAILADLNIQQAGDGLGSVGLVCGMTSVPMLLHVVPAFGLRAGPEKEELSKAAQGLHGFGYGADMCSVGLDMLQTPSLRVVTQGHRWTLLLPLEAIAGFLKSMKKGEKATFHDVMAWLHALQPSNIAAFLSVYPDSIYHGLLWKDSIAYVPPAWILAEKAEVPELCSVHVRVASACLCLPFALLAGGEPSLHLRVEDPMAACHAIRSESRHCGRVDWRSCRGISGKGPRRCVSCQSRKLHASKSRWEALQQRRNQWRQRTQMSNEIPPLNQRPPLGKLRRSQMSPTKIRVRACRPRRIRLRA